MLEFKKIEGFPRYKINILGEIYDTEKDILLKKHLDKDGYLKTSLRNENLKKNKIKFVHRLIAQTFIPNPDPCNLLEINHINGIKTDNSINNLEWCSRKENIKHGYKTGLIPTKLTEEQVLEIRNRYRNENITQRKLGSIYKVCQQQISNIINDKLWKHI